ncbi:MAG: response regulator [Bacteroidetes bacterium]|jgi:CheY-like chemotaxis protein|nr:response regulator [Bacteroidota bacterium]
MATSTTRANKIGRICIVDDTAIHVALLRAILEPRGHTIIPMTSPEEAIDEVLLRPPDVLIVDINMPGMDGFTLVEEVRSRGLKAETRIVFMTSHSRDVDVQRATDLGSAGLIRKPFDAEETIRSVERLIGAPAETTKTDSVVTPMHQQLLSVLESAWRLSLPEDILSGHRVSSFTADQIIQVATAQVAGLARDRGIDIHVEPCPTVPIRGDRELASIAWGQVLRAAIIHAEPGSAVNLSLSSAPGGITVRVSFMCSASTAALLTSVRMSGPAGSPITVEPRREGGVNLLVDIWSGM